MRHGRTHILADTHKVPMVESLRHPDASLQVPQLLAKMQFAAGAPQLETLAAQALAEAFLGDAIVSNILMRGYGWLRGLVPVGLAALQRAIALNGVAVASNLLAFSLGRLAAADPQALAALLTPAAAVPAHPAALADDTLEALLAHATTDLSAYQSAAYAGRYAAFVHRVATHERALGTDATLHRRPFPAAVARPVRRRLPAAVPLRARHQAAS